MPHSKPNRQASSVVETKRYMALCGHTLISESTADGNVILDYRATKRPDVVFRIIHDRNGRHETEYL